MAYLFYALVKYASYAAWCWFGLWLWRRGSARPGPALGLGLLRLCIGIFVGLSIFFLVSVNSSNLLSKYLEVYIPVRMVEWLVLAFAIRRSFREVMTLPALAWCIGGIVVSFASDLASPEGLAGHFCVGRCLC